MFIFEKIFGLIYLIALSNLIFCHVHLHQYHILKIAFYLIYVENNINTK